MRLLWQEACCLLAASLCFAASIAAQSPRFDDQALATRIAASSALPFEAVHLPLHSPSPGWELGPVSGVASGADGNLYVMQRGDKADPVLVFGQRGELIRSWGRGDFVLPHSLRLDALGNVWAIDAGASRIVKYSSGGKKLLVITIEPVPDTGSPFRGVTDVAFAPDGHLFVTDGYGNARVIEYTAEGKKLREWGHPGTAPGDFHLPHAIAIDKGGTVFVADRENGRIERFDQKGRFLGSFDGLGRCYALALRGGVLWASMSPMGKDPGAPGWLVKLDPKTGRILGHLDLLAERVGHATDVLPTGEPVVTAGDGLICLRRDKVLQLRLVLFSFRLPIAPDVPLQRRHPRFHVFLKTYCVNVGGSTRRGSHSLRC